jgi:hypothetical protein
MKNKKGGYKVKNGFYIKNECKNNEADGSIDDEGYILDPLTYERIEEGKIIQLSDGLCYEKSINLRNAIQNRKTLPFGHPVTKDDNRKFKKKKLVILGSTDSQGEIPAQIIESPPLQILSPTPEIISTPERIIPPVPNVPGFLPEWHPATNSYILRREQPQRLPTPEQEEEIQLIQSPRRITPRTARNRRPLLIIESDSPEEIELSPVQVPVPTPRRRGRPPGSRNRTTRGNTGRGKKRNKSKKH